jgi:hypothetical protein
MIELLKKGVKFVWEWSMWESFPHVKTTLNFSPSVSTTR